MLDKTKAVHLIGIGGVGMSALAELLVTLGYKVTGSERFLDSGKRLPVLVALESQGIVLFPQTGESIDPATTGAIVASTAIESTNSDIAAANRFGIPILHRSEALAQCLENHKLIAIAGTCGKSTTTAMVGHLLAELGLSPLVVNGAAVVNWRSETRTGAVFSGSGEYAVAEVDESDKSLMNFHPALAVITNCSADHFCLLETNELFDAFKMQVKDKVIDGRVEQIPEITEGEWSVEFDYKGNHFLVPLPGKHNGENAYWAVRVAETLGIPLEKAAAALTTFGGVARRLELVGTKDGARIIDEYAHNTEKLRASIMTMQARAKRVLVLWRPHGYAPLKKMFSALEDMFAETLRPSDALYLLPVFDAGGTTSRTIQSDELAAALKQHGVNVEYVLTHEEAFNKISPQLAQGVYVGVFGARDPELTETANRLCH